MLKTKHFFPFIKMIKALDIKDELKQIYEKAKEKNTEELAELDESEGIDYFFLFIEKLPAAEREVMGFLSVYLDKSIEAIGEMPIDEMWEVISGIFEDPNFKAFFQQAVK